MVVTQRQPPIKFILFKNLRGTLKNCLAFSSSLKFFALLVLTFFPAAITCSPPPQIGNGKHSGAGAEKFVYNSTVTYSCEAGFQLVGEASIRCTSSDGTDAAWSGAVPECKGDFTLVRVRYLVWTSFTPCDCLARDMLGVGHCSFKEEKCSAAEVSEERPVCAGKAACS